jgi:integration host factor subunit alpha
MRKADIADALVERVGIARKESGELVELFLTIIKETLGREDSVKIAEFGSFLVHKKHERKGRNMKTGVQMQIKPRTVVRFKASCQFKEAVIRPNGKTIL